MLNDVCTLVSETELVSDEGYGTAAQMRHREVFCEVSKPGREEFYKSLSAGMAADLVITVNAEDYDGETLVEWGGVLYRLIRYYKTAGLLVEMSVKQEAAFLNGDI